MQTLSKEIQKIVRDGRPGHAKPILLKLVEELEKLFHAIYGIFFNLSRHVFKPLYLRKGCTQNTRKGFVKLRKDIRYTFQIYFLEFSLNESDILSQQNEDFLVIICSRSPDISRIQICLRDTHIPGIGWIVFKVRKELLYVYFCRF